MVPQPDESKVSEADIDTWMQGDRRLLGSATGDKAREVVRGFVAREQAGRARGEALAARLLKDGLKTNGTPIPESLVVEELIALFGRRIDARRKPTLLMDSIKESVIAAEAKRQGVDASVIAEDADLVGELIVAVEIEGVGKTFALGDYSIGGGLGQFLTWRALALEAREQGADKDAEFVAKLEEFGMESGMERAMRVRIYYTHHGVGGVSADELDAAVQGVTKALRNRKREGGQDAFRDYLQSAKLKSQQAGNPEITDADLSDAELDTWLQAVTEAIGGAEKSNLRNYVGDAILRWRQQAFLAEVRKSAKIKYLVDLP